MVGYFQQLAFNNAWANATLYRALEGLSADAFAAPRPGFFPSLRETLNHLYAVDLYYIDAVLAEGQGLALFDRAEIGEPSTLARAQAASDARLSAYCGALTEARLQETRVTERPEGPVEERVDALLLHLFQHQIHHRGQAHVQLQEAGRPPPQLDEFFLIYERAPSAQAYWR